MAVGLLAWAVVLTLQLNPATDLSRLKRTNTGTTPALATTTQSGAELYASACASCHQTRGEGRHPVFPPLAGSPWVTGDPMILSALTLHGASGPMDVNDIPYQGLMPGFQHLRDDELAVLLTYVRTSWGNQSSGLTASDVAAVRDLTRDRQAPWTAQELQSFAPPTAGAP